MADMGKVLLNAVVILLVLFAAERAVSLPPAFLWEQRANAQMCAVYRSFYREMSKENAPVLHSGTARCLPVISVFDAEYRASGSLNQIEFQPGMWPVAGSRSKYVLDVSSYFAPLMAEQSLFVRHCFDGSASAGFFDGPPVLLTLREFLSHLSGGEDVVWLQVSPLGFSRDGKRALMYATHTCYGWCGYGKFFLFERRGREWVLAGTSLAWIA